MSSGVGFTGKSERMTDTSSVEATDSLVELARGRASAAERLLPLVYDKLRQIAGDLMRGERPDHTLQPTAVVHEAYMRLIQIDKVDWQDKAHFCALAARQMRRVLVDHARARMADKRSGGVVHVTLTANIPLPGTELIEMLALDEALDKLARNYPRPAQVAEMKMFGGLRSKEISVLLEIKDRTISCVCRPVRRTGILAAP